MLRLLYCYAREDAALVTELRKHLEPLKRDSGIEIWHPGELVGGDERDAEIARRIDEAEVILLMLSIDFLSSSGGYAVQLKQALKRHDDGKARVIPILLRSADYSGAPFMKLQGLPKDGRPVASHPDRDFAWAEIALAIRATIRAVPSARPRPEANKPRRAPAPKRESSTNRPSAITQYGANAPTHPSHLPWLEARFRKSDGQWWVQLVPETGIAREKLLRIPTRDEDALGSLFHEDDDVDLMERPWRLRLRPREFDVDSEWPPVKSWANLRHPEDECHLLDRGWTIAELTARPRQGHSSGVVAVRADAPLLHSLRKLLGPRVVSASGCKMPQGAILVTQGVTSSADIASLQEAALNAECPLVIWAEPQQIPRSRLAEVIVLRETREPISSWLVRFLSRILSGIDPERAFAHAGLDGPPEDRSARWLRGAFSTWHVDPPENPVALDPRWFVRLDRSRQESDLNRLVHHLVHPNAKRRIQVVISIGPEGSGVELFCHRPPLISPELPRVPVVEWDLTWTESPANQEQRLMQRLRSRRAADLPERLLSEAVRIHEQHVGMKGSRVLFWGRHDIGCLIGVHDSRHVTLDDLESYFAALASLAMELARTEIRLLLSLPFRGQSREDLARLECDRNYFKVNVLPVLPAGVPADELRAWLSDAGLPYDDDTIAHMMTLSYDALVQWLVERYPELLSL